MCMSGVRPEYDVSVYCISSKDIKWLKNPPGLNLNTAMAIFLFIDLTIQNLCICIAQPRDH